MAYFAIDVADEAAQWAADQELQDTIKGTQHPPTTYEMIGLMCLGEMRMGGCIERITDTEHADQFVAALERRRRLRALRWSEDGKTLLSTPEEIAKAIGSSA